VIGVPLRKGVPKTKTPSGEIVKDADRARGRRRGEKRRSVLIGRCISCAKMAYAVAAAGRNSFALQNRVCGAPRTSRLKKEDLSQNGFDRPEIGVAL
jgi:hypothetical protein